jgi:hydroxylaminobenzene mutase
LAWDDQSSDAFGGIVSERALASCILCDEDVDIAREGNAEPQRDVLMIKKVDIALVRAGFVLLTLAFLTGFVIPAFHNPRMGVAAHLGAIINALILIVLGLVWELFVFGEKMARLTRVAFLYAAYGSWVVACLAAAWGTSRATPISGAGYSAAPWKEFVVQSLQVSIVMIAVVGAVSAVYGLRSRKSVE